MTQKNSPEDEKLRQRNKDSFQNTALYWNKLANDRIFEISKQLLAVALIILPLSGSIILTYKRIDSNEKSLLFYTWILLLASIVSGFYHLWTEAKYFHYLSNDSSTREEIWSDTNRSIQDLNKDTIKLGKTRPGSSNIPLIIQVATLFLGVILILFIVNSMLYYGHAR
jgi:hypothetical protein